MIRIGRPVKTMLLARVAEATLAAVSIVVGCVLFESAFRLYNYWGFAVNADYIVVTTDAYLSPTRFGEPGSRVGPYPPNITFTFSFYNAAGELALRHPVHTNNLGWISRSDYTPRPTPGEFRLVVIGASLTASINNATSWPDLVEEYLNEDTELRRKLGVDRITVLTIAAAGASLQFMAYPLSSIASEFSPNLYVLNFSTDNLSQRHYAGAIRDAEMAGRTSPTATAVATAAAQPVPHLGERDLVVDDVSIPLYCPAEGGESKCVVSSIWYVPPEMMLDSKHLNDIKRRVAYKLAFDRIILSDRWFILDAIKRISIGRVHAQIVPESGKSDSVTSDYSVGLEAFQFVRHFADRLAIIHNPTFDYLKRRNAPNGKTQYSILQDFRKYVEPAGFTVYSMEDYLPIERGEAEWRKWYNLPNDGHWSDAGARVYAAAVAGVIRRQLLGTAPTASVDDRYRRARERLDAGDSTGALAILDKVGRGNELAMIELRAQAESALGRTNEALAELAKALDLATAAGDPATTREIRMKRAELHAQQRDYPAAVSDIDAALVFAPKDQGLLAARGDAELAMGNAQAAVADYARALSVGPASATLYFQLWQARTRAADHRRALEAANAAIDLDPANADLYFCRASSLVALRRPDDAKIDLSKALALKPELTIAKRLLATIGG